MDLQIGGEVVQCVTIGELSKMCGRSVSALRKLEERGIFPTANFRTASRKIKSGDNAGATRLGFRIYSIDLAKSIAELFKEDIRQGLKVTDQTKEELLDLFQEERERLLNI